MPKASQRHKSLAPPRSSVLDGVERVPLRMIIDRLDAGVSVNAEDRPAAGEEHGVLKVSAVTIGHFNPEENKVVVLRDLPRVGLPPRRGDLLVTRANTRFLVAAAAMVPRDFPRLHLSDKIWKVVLRDSERDDLRWLRHVLSSGQVRAALVARASGTSGSMKNISKSDFLGITVHRLPTTQQRIAASILDTFDDAIDRVRNLIKVHRKLKRGLLQQLLTGQRRFPEFRKQPWVEHRLGDLFEERIELGRVELPLLSITADRGIVPRDSIDRSDTSSADKSLYKRIAPGDIGYNTMRMWQGVSALSSLDGIVSPAYTICSPCKGVHGAYFAHLFKFPPVVHRFWRYSQGLVDDTLNLKFHEFSQVRVNVPSDVREQERIATLLDTTDLELAQLRAMHEALKKQKKGLMQKLLTGQVRVPASMLKEAAHA